MKETRVHGHRRNKGVGPGWTARVGVLVFRPRPARRSCPGANHDSSDRPGEQTLDVALGLTHAAPKAIIREVIEALVIEVDLTELVKRHVDINQIATVIDLDTVAARIGIDAILNRVDLDAVIETVDLNRAVAASISMRSPRRSTSRQSSDGST